jgi:serine/threonine protein kinase
MPTEYMQHRKLSEKTDAYALGIVLLELLTGLWHMHIVEQVSELMRCQSRLIVLKSASISYQLYYIIWYYTIKL